MEQQHTTPCRLPARHDHIVTYMSIRLKQVRSVTPASADTTRQQCPEVQVVVSRCDAALCIPVSDSRVSSPLSAAESLRGPAPGVVQSRAAAGFNLLSGPCPRSGGSVHGTCDPVSLWWRRPSAASPRRPPSVGRWKWELVKENT